MKKQMIKDRAEFVRQVGEEINNAGVIEWANEVMVMCNNRKMSAEAIVRTEAFKVVTRIFCR